MTDRSTSRKAKKENATVVRTTSDYGLKVGQHSDDGPYEIIEAKKKVNTQIGKFFSGLKGKLGKSL